MYESYFGLTARPFDLTPNPAYLVPLHQHREAVSTLEYALRAGKGLVMLTGEAGTGKTTVLRTALTVSGADRHVVTLQNPSMTRAEFLESLALAFGLSPRAASSKAFLLRELLDRLHALNREGRRAALIVDEAQTLATGLLEEVRLLGNLETDTEKLLPIVLAAQPELTARLNRPDLRQLKQRVALRCELRPLLFEETTAYINARLRMAGSDRHLFTREALRLIHLRSRGIPRSINVICDNALIAALAAAAPLVGDAQVREVCRDLDIGAPAEAVVQPAGNDPNRSVAAAVGQPAPPAAATPPGPERRQAATAKAEHERPLFTMFAPRRRLWLFR